MKLFFLVAGTALTALFATSCDEDLTSTPLSIDNLDSTTLRIYPRANLDLTSAGDELLPAGTMVTVTVPYSNYSFAGQGGSGSSSVILRDTVNSNGFVEFSVPVDDSGVTATVSIDGFEFDQVQADGSTKAAFYSFTPAVYNLTIGGKTIKEITVASIIVLDESSTLLPATLVGNVTGEFNKQTAGNETAPEGTIVIVTKTSGAEDFETEATLDANGQFSVAVEVNVSGTDDFEVTIRSFIAVQTQTVGSTPATMNVEFATRVIDYDNIVPGQTKIENIVLDAPTSVDPEEAVEFVTISGTIYSETDEDQGTDPAIRESLDNKTFTFYTDETDGVLWSLAVTTDGNGKYTVDVPVDQPIYLSCLFEMGRNLDTGEVDEAFDPIYEVSTWRLNVSDYEVTAGVSFDQGGTDVGSEDAADVFAADWTEVVQP